MALSPKKQEAWLLKKQGLKQYEIAQRLGVSPATISLWLKSIRNGEDKKLGRPRKLDDNTLALIDKYLAQPPKVWGISIGYLGDHRWTNAHIALLIKREFGVTYSRRQIRRLLPKFGPNGRRLRRSLWRRRLRKFYIIRYKNKHNKDE